MERRVALRELARRTGIKVEQLSGLMNGGGSGAGLVALIRFAEYAGRTPGALLDEALHWWDKGDGKAFAESKLFEIAERKSAKVKPASSRRPSAKPANR